MATAFAEIALAPRERARPPLFDPQAAPVGRLLAVMYAVTAVLGMTLGFDYVGRDLNSVIATGGYVLAMAVLLRRVGFARIATLLETTVATVASALGACFLTLVLARTNAPLADPWLAAADRLLFPAVEWRTVFDAVRGNAAWVRAIAAIYETLAWQPFVLTAALALTGRGPAAWRFLHAWLFALLICATTFAVMPALGTFAHYGIQPSDIPALSVRTGWQQPEMLHAIRAGAIHSFDPARASGIVAFPSFHAAAVLLSWGYARFQVVGYGFIGLNVAMAATAIVAGAHYFTDIAAGIATALIAIAISRRG